MSMRCKQDGTPILSRSFLPEIGGLIPFRFLARWRFEPGHRQVWLAWMLALWVCLLPMTGAAATLLGEYHFEEPQWTGAANEVIDTSGNNRHGQGLGSPVPTTASGSPARSGNPGTCGYGSFAGGALNLPVAANTAAGAKTTVSFWMYWDGTNSVMPIGWQRHDIWMIDGNIGFNTSAGDLYGASSAGLANRWTHVVAEFTNGSVITNKLYIDGVLQALSQKRGTPNNAYAVVHANLRVSGWQNDSNYRFGSRLDDVKVFDGALTQPEVTALFNETHTCAPRLVQEWRLDACALGLTAGEVLDESGNGNHGTPVGATASGAGRVCKAAVFDGASARIKAATNYVDSITNDFTMAFWVNPTVPHEVDVQSTSGSDGTSGQHYAIYPAKGNIAWSNGHAGAGVSVGTNGISVYENANNYMPPLLVWAGSVSGWTHVAVVYQAKQPRLYVNGVLVATGLTSTKSSIHPGLRSSGGPPNSDGGLGGGQLGWFAGGIDEFRVYDGALSAPAVASISGIPSRACATCTTLAKYRLEEPTWTGAAGEIQDSSGNARHGNALGTPIPAPNTALSPARVGNPGTCGYANLTGGALNLPVAANTAAGAKTTVSFWMYWDGTNSVMPVGWMSHDLWLTGGFFGFNTANSDVYGINSAGLANRWAHVVAVFTNGSVTGNKLYIDGVAQALSQKLSSPNLVNAVVNANLRVSGWLNNTSYRFRTRIDEVEVFDGEMTQSQVLARYNETHPCGGAPSATPAGFNAFETSTAGGSISGVIKTKIAASNFNLAIVALKTGGTAIETAFASDVKLEIVDASVGGSCGAYALIRNLGTLTFTAPDSGRKNQININEPNAWPNARIRMTYPATGAPTIVACSTDNFAIRPASFGSVVASDLTSTTAGAARTLANIVVTGGNVHKAGRPFQISATAHNAAATTTTYYVGAPTPSLVACVLPGSGCVLGTLAAGTWSAASGVATTTQATYSEVGAFSMKLVDTTFAAVDSADGSTAIERNIESAVINVGRFVPDHFDLTPASIPVFKTFNDTACSTRSFTYVGQPFGYVTTPQATITARNATGGQTVNYTGTLWKLDALGVAPFYAAVTGTLDGVPGVPVVNSTGGGTGTLALNAADTVSFARTTPVAPFNADISLSISIGDTAENAVAGNGIIDTLTPAVFSSIAFDSGNQIRFGRLVLSNAHGSEVLSLPVPAETQFWKSAGFIHNSADSCTQLAAVNVGLSNWQRNLNACETSVSLSGRFNAGRGNLKLSAPAVPGNANTGSVDLTLYLGAAGAGSTCPVATVTGADQTWLQGAWTGTAYDDNPVARGSFGLHRGNKPLIYMREMY